MKKGVRIQKKSRLKLLHQYYTYTGFYSYVGRNLKKAILPVLAVIVVLFLFNTYIYNINDGLQRITEIYHTNGILFIFFLSESFLGLIPPEIFIAWSKKTTNPVLYLSMLAILSYIGGIISYYIGNNALRVKSVKHYLENKMVKHIKNTKKWGSFLILTGALLPIPFSITCIAAGMIKYPLKRVIVFGLFRFLRFAIYALAIFQIVH